MVRGSGYASPLAALRAKRVKGVKKFFFAFLLVCVLDHFESIDIHFIFLKISRERSDRECERETPRERSDRVAPQG